MTTFPKQTFSLEPFVNPIGFFPFLFLPSALCFLFCSLSYSFLCCTFISLIFIFFLYFASIITFFFRYLVPTNKPREINICKKYNTLKWTPGISFSAQFLLFLLFLLFLHFRFLLLLFLFLCLLFLFLFFFFFSCFIFLLLFLLFLFFFFFIFFFFCLFFFPSCSSGCLFVRSHLYSFSLVLYIHINK